MKIFIILLLVVLFGCKQKPGQAPEIPSSGQQLFSENYGACHSKHSLMVIGPALESMKTENEVELLFNYLQNKKMLQIDTAFIALTLGE